ncbi:MAG: hypothetical protein JXA74_09935 [Anaerolineae bacterium]|nr:hypothetical protein [Anaerolineae bacterium]
MGFSVLTIILLPVLLVLLLLIFITLNRYIRYKERVALAQLGLPLDAPDWRDRAKFHGSRGVLWGGVITATSGLALLLGLATLGVGVWLLAGFLPLFVGLGMILIYFLTPGTTASVSGVEATGVEATGEFSPHQAPDLADNGGNPEPPFESRGHNGQRSAASPGVPPDKAAKR